jgi:hypothetical protein
LARTDKRPASPLTNNRNMRQLRHTDRDVFHRRISVLAATTLVGVRLMAIGIPATEPPKFPAGSPSPRAVRQTFTAARTRISLRIGVNVARGT